MWTKVHYSTICWSLPGSKFFLTIISMKMFLIISERRAGFLILVTSIYLIMQFGTWQERCSTRTYSSMKTFKGFQKQCQIHGIDRQKNSSIIQSNMADAIRKSGRRRRWSYWTPSLTTLTFDSMYIFIVIDILLINRKLYMIKWL